MTRIILPEEIKDPVTKISYYVYEPKPETVPRVISPSFISQRENQDIRQTLAYALFEQGKEINIPLMGTPRSGISSYLIAESLNRDETVLLVSSNKNVGEIIPETVNNSNSKNSDNVVSILPAKKGCSKIQLDLVIYPKLYDIPIIPLPKIENGCKGCEYYESCKYTKISYELDKEFGGKCKNIDDLILRAKNGCPISLFLFSLNILNFENTEK